MRSGAHDYYRVLGVDPLITATELRQAWRRLALRWHPDRAGAEATSTFQELAAAYAVLSDPVARAAYDRTRPVATGPRASHKAAPARPRASRVPAVMLSRMTGPLESLLACGAARRADSDVIDLFLDEDEAAQGGMITIAMYVDTRCPSCDGREPLARCPPCAGTRMVKERFSAWLAVPPGVPDGSVLTPSVDLPRMIRRPEFRVRRRPSS